MEQTRKHHAAQSRTARDRIVDREVAKLESRMTVAHSTDPHSSDPAHRVRP